MHIHDPAPFSEDLAQPGSQLGSYGSYGSYGTCTTLSLESLETRTGPFSWNLGVEIADEKFTSVKQRCSLHLGQASLCNLAPLPAPETCIPRF